MGSIQLNLTQSKQYTINIGVDLFNLTKQDWKNWLQDNKIAIVTNNKLALLYGNKLKEKLTFFGFDVHLITVEDGEVSKNLMVVSEILDELMQLNFNRKSTLIALGGGVIGDLTGFVASIFMRGMNLIQIPTSLLSMVDSSVGGKTGVNHRLGKNMIGSFYQPHSVLIDPVFLDSLEKREYLSGFAEIIKYALIMDAPFFTWLKQNANALLQRDKDCLTYAITTSCRSKTKVVMEDEKEAGVRALLNLGHTFGHAIETTLGYGKWLHGEAVALGMIWAAELSKELNHLNQKQVKEIKSLIGKFNLPTKLNQSIDLNEFFKNLLHDKKFDGGEIRLILLKDIGQSYIDNGVSLERLKQFMGSQNF